MPEGSIQRRKNIAKSITEISRLVGFRDGFIECLEQARKRKMLSESDSDELLLALVDTQRKINQIEKRTGLDQYSRRDSMADEEREAA